MQELFYKLYNNIKDMRDYFQKAIDNDPSLKDPVSQLTGKIETLNHILDDANKMLKQYDEEMSRYYEEENDGAC